MKGLSSDYKSHKDIKYGINDVLGFSPVQVIIMKKRTQSGIARKMLSQEYYLGHFNNKDPNNIEALEKARLIFDVRVTWEHFQKPGGNFQNPTQYRRCQKWDHRTKNCRMDAKCMICGGLSHAKDVCPVKEDTDEFICANCGGYHMSIFGLALRVGK